MPITFYLFMVTLVYLYLYTNAFGEYSTTSVSESLKYITSFSVCFDLRIIHLIYTAGEV